MTTHECPNCGWLPSAVLLDSAGKQVGEPGPINTLPMCGSKSAAVKRATDWADRVWPGNGLRFKATPPRWHSCALCSADEP